MTFPDSYTNRVIHGDCLSIMRDMPDGCVDAVVTDPPYGLQFMGKEWDKLWRNVTDADKTYISHTSSESDGLTSRRRNLPDLKSTGAQMQEWHLQWATEALRVLKPGGHLLAFGGSRTYHRLACAIEDAGFEIRDTLCWLFGSGFPKSLDVSKAIDKAAGIWRGRAGAVSSENATMSGGNYERKAKGSGETAAAAWDGWGTALKPAAEYIVMARKPLGESTVAANVLAHGTGAINVDGCRVRSGDTYSYPNGPLGNSFSVGKSPDNTRTIPAESNPLGRWPANVIHDGSEEVVGLFPETVPLGSAAHSASRTAWPGNKYQGTVYPRDSGSAARFFYCAKASKEDRDWALRDGGVGALRDGGRDNTEARRNLHPTVKPLALMRYLCRLVTPPGGIVLDPFAGSGSTCRSAFVEGFQFIGIEIDAEYCRIANGRLNLLTAGLPI